jgi:tRNA threonylcarbamoyladenosine biosynthesis protein TsaB
MTLFYIDTTSSYLYTAIVRDNSLLIERKKDLGKSLSVETTNIVSEMFNEVNLKPSDINKIIVVNGPGSFTGIRIGVTLAKIMAYTLDIPITTITSLEAMAKSIDTNKLIVPIINARREACYAAIYDGNKEIMAGSYLTIEKLKMMLIGLSKDYVFISNDKFSFECKKYDPDILNIVNYYKDRERINPHLVNPLYLKLTEAEENRLKDND